MGCADLEWPVASHVETRAPFGLKETKADGGERYRQLEMASALVSAD
jgi:hypothetical protein